MKHSNKFKSPKTLLALLLIASFLVIGHTPTASGAAENSADNSASVVLPTATPTPTPDPYGITPLDDEEIVAYI